MQNTATDIPANSAIDTSDPPSSGGSSAPAYQPLTYDPALYTDDLKGSDLSDERRAEILEALWVIICVFIDLDVPIPAPESCGQVAEIEGGSGAESADLLESKDHTLAKPFERAGKLTAPATKEES